MQSKFVIIINALVVLILLLTPHCALGCKIEKKSLKKRKKKCKKWKKKSEMPADCVELCKKSTKPEKPGLGNGEEECEDQKFNENQCNAIGCCEWDRNKDKCWSAVEKDQCKPTDPGLGNGEVECEGQKLTKKQCKKVGCCNWNRNKCNSAVGTDECKSVEPDPEEPEEPELCENQKKKKKCKKADCCKWKKKKCNSVVGTGVCNENTELRTYFYNLDLGTCPDPGKRGIPCVDGINPSLQELCDIYGEYGSFRECLKICRPSYCCVHDAPRDNDVITPSCLDDENCPQYSSCSVVWWKFADTAGPAIYFSLEQDNAFFDMTNEDITTEGLGLVSDITTEGLGLVSDVVDFNIDLEGDPYNFFNQLLLHNFHNKSKIIEYGTNINTTEFSKETLFNNKNSWAGTRRERPTNP